MPRLIDADELYVDARCGENEEPYISLYQINDAPTVEAEPVRHGHWEWDGDYICSNCGERGRRNKWNYCPNCGAKMDESTMSQVKPSEGERREDAETD